MTRHALIAPIGLLLMSTAFLGCSDDATPAPDAHVITDASSHDLQDLSAHEASTQDALPLDTSTQDASSAPLQVTVDITYPKDAVGDAQRPTIAVYEKSAYPDTSVRPVAMPVAALLGQPKANTLKGTILDLLQKSPFTFKAAVAYVVVAGVSADKGMPSHLAGTAWMPIEVTLSAGEHKTLTIAGDDAAWKQ